MILSLGQDSYYRYPYILCFNTLVDQKSFLHRAKAKPGTYADDLLSGLHDAIFHRSLELRRDYAEIVCTAYPTFSEYLRKRFRFTPKVIHEITTCCSRNLVHHLF